MKNLLTPHITEKSYQGYADESIASTYTFIVKPNVDKFMVKKLVEKEFKVKVADVRIINLPGKKRRFKNIAGQTSPISKAIVRLKKGDHISAFDIDTKEEKSDKQKTEDKA